MDSRQIKILQSASANVDKDQSRVGSYKHAMRSPGQSAEEAEQLMNKFLDKKLNEFMTKDGDEALYALGEALHPIMDSTSPSHQGFQEWEGLGTLPKYLKAGIHFLREGLYISDETHEETVEMVRKFYSDAVKKKKVAEEQR